MDVNQARQALASLIMEAIDKNTPGEGTFVRSAV